MTNKLDGMDAFLKMIDPVGVPKRVKEVVRQNGAELTEVMKNNANFRGHIDRTGKFVPPTGTTKRSIALRLESGGYTASVGPGTYYSPFLEYGTRYMSAQPFVFRSLDVQEPTFLKDLAKVMIK